MSRAAQAPTSTRPRESPQAGKTGLTRLTRFRRSVTRPGSDLLGSNADRVPDGLELEEGRDLPRALVVGRTADDALDVLGGQPLELGDVPVSASDVDRVHVHVPREPRRQLLVQARDD